VCGERGRGLLVVVGFVHAWRTVPQKIEVEVLFKIKLLGATRQAVLHVVLPASSAVLVSAIASCRHASHGVGFHNEGFLVQCAIVELEPWGGLGVGFVSSFAGWRRAEPRRA